MSRSRKTFRRVTNGAAAACLVAATLLAAGGRWEAAGRAEAAPAAVPAHVVPAELRAGLDEADRDLEAGRFERVLAAVANWSASYPDEAVVRMYEARAHRGLARWRAAAGAYRQALKLNRDLADPATAAYAGDEIGAMVRAATVEIPRRLDVVADAGEREELRAALRDAYYLQRKLAGGCE